MFWKYLEKFSNYLYFILSYSCTKSLLIENWEGSTLISHENLVFGEKIKSKSYGSHLAIMYEGNRSYWNTSGSKGSLSPPP